MHHKLYSLTYVWNLKDNQVLDSFKHRYLKFYANGKVGTFYFYNLSDMNSLNPKKADIGYYNYRDGQLIVQSYFDHVQGGGYVKEFFIKKNDSTIVFTNIEYVHTYKIINLPKNFLIYKPDW